MKDIQTRELQRVLKFIEAIGCQYAVVTDDGETFTNGLEVKAAKPRMRGPLMFPYGEIRSFVMTQLDVNAAIGSVQELAVGKYGAERVRSNVCNVLTEQWGKDTYTTSVTEHTVEVLRTA